MIAALQRSGKSERTQQSSVREGRLLAQLYRTSPDLISAQALQPYLLHRKNIEALAPSSMRICSSGIRFFSHHVLGRDWKTLDLMRAASAHRLPAMLSLEEVHRLLHAATPLHKRVSCTTVYSCGLRLHEALALQGSAIESARHLVHVHRGKGATDR
jgi:site-specific recombinase XerD